MVKNALKNFFKNSIFIFVPMGIVYLFFLIAVFIAIGSLVKITGTAFSQTFELVRDSVGASSSVNEYLDYAFKQLQWNGNIIDTVVAAFRTRWLTTTLKGFFGELAETTEGFNENLDLIVGDFLVKLRAIISAAIVLCVLGIVLANFLTRVMVRKRTAKRGFKKFFIAHTILPIAQALFVVASVVVLVIIRYYGLLVVAALLILSCAFSLTSSWVVHRSGGLKWKDVVTMRNILMHLASVGVILLLNIALAAAFFAVNSLLAILIMIPVILYSLNIVGVNTDSFVCGMIEGQSAAAGSTEAAPAEGAGEAEVAAGEFALAETAGAAPSEGESKEAETPSAKVIKRVDNTPR